MPDFDQALKLVLAEEGGRVQDPRDPGGRTNKGITQRTYDAWLALKGKPRLDVYNISDADMAAIYRTQYADVIRFDDLPDGVGYAVFDFDVNSGEQRSAEVLQTCVGAKQDGRIGVMTIAAVKAVDASKLINAYCDARLQFLRSLSTWSTFGLGWTNRVNRVRAAALLMAGGSAPSSTDTRWLQETLNTLGADPVLAVDGFLGPRTMAALYAWQFRHELAQGDVDTKTIVALKNALIAPKPPIAREPAVEPPKGLWATIKEWFGLS